MKELFNAIRVALGGKSLSTAALEVVAEDLDIYPREKVLTALGRCLIECRGNLFLCDVIQRMDDGHLYVPKPFWEDKEFIDFVNSGRRSN
jgi:hypothetical protein